MPLHPTVLLACLTVLAGSDEPTERKASPTETMPGQQYSPGQAKPGQAPPRKPGGGGLLLKIQDPDGLLDGQVKAVLKTSDGTERTFKLRDDGTFPDAQARDLTYTAPVFGISPGTIDLLVKDDEREWSRQATLEAGDTAPLLEYLIKGESLMEMGSETRRAPQGKLVIANESGQVIQTTHPPETEGYWLWFVLAGALGVGTWAGSVWFGRRPPGVCRLDESPAAFLPPTRLEWEHLDQALSGPLSGYRVVCLGELEHQTGNVIPCIEQSPLPTELLRAVERLAATVGPPVALLLTAPDLLDLPGGADSLETLEKAVAGRFPLWVVDGPCRWQDWQPGSLSS